MSVGLSLLKTIITSGHASAGFLRDINPVMLKPEDERPLFEFVRNHVHQYGTLPNLDTVLQSGYQLPHRVMEGTAYYLAELKKRHAHAAMTNRLAAFTDGLRNNNPSASLNELRAMLADATPALTERTYSTLATQVQRVITDYEYARLHPGMRGVTLGWPTADEYTLGAQGGDLIGIAGRSGLGKTWLMLEAVNAAHAAGFVPLVISMEMTLIQMAYRYVGRVSGINPKLIKKGELSEWSRQLLYQVAGGLQAEGEVPLYFMAGDMDKQVSSVEALMDDLCPDIVFIDGAYLLTGEAKKRGSAKWEELGEVMSALKKLFVKKDRPCVMTVQLNRNVTKSTKRKLDTSDVGGSDRIPQDMSVLWGVKPGQAPYTRTRRVMDWVKNREDEAKDFATLFQFAPVSFEEVSYDETLDEEQEETGNERQRRRRSNQSTNPLDAPATVNTGWMI